MRPSVLIVPGIGNSGPDHWQTVWEAGDASMTRLGMKDWEDSSCSSWVAAIDRHLERAGQPFVVAAHSLGCLAFVHWAARHRRPVRGVLLVAVPDPAGPGFPAGAEGFSPLPPARLPFASIVVASRDDPYSSPEFAESCAAAWGSRLVDIGLAGHINAASNLGRWPEGLRLLDELRSVPAASTQTTP